MNVVYFGSGAFGLPTLEHLAREHTLLAVVTQPDRPAGRGGKATPTPIAAWAAEHLPKVALHKPARVNEASIRDELRSLPADAGVVIAFGQKLGEPLLADRFAVNLHASLLPRWRGAAPINAAVLAGDAETGNSVITLADRMDAGLVLGQSRRPIEPNQTAGELHDLLAADGPALVEDVLSRHAAGTLEPVTQDESLVTLAAKMSKADGVIDFADDAATNRRRVHGLTPWPGVTVRHRDEPLKLLRVATAGLDRGAAPAGTLVDARAGLVACGDGRALKLIEVQPAAKRAMPWADYANGRSVRDGERFNGG